MEIYHRILKNDGYKFVSFDVVSLFTNVPLKRTLDIILNRVYKDKLIQTTLKKVYAQETDPGHMYQDSFPIQWQIVRAKRWRKYGRFTWSIISKCNNDQTGKESRKATYRRWNHPVLYKICG